MTEGKRRVRVKREDDTLVTCLRKQTRETVDGDGISSRLYSERLHSEKDGKGKRGGFEERMCLCVYVCVGSCCLPRGHCVRIS